MLNATIYILQFVYSSIWHGSELCVYKFAILCDVLLVMHWRVINELQLNQQSKLQKREWERSARCAQKNREERKTKRALRAMELFSDK